MGPDSTGWSQLHGQPRPSAAICAQVPSYRLHLFAGACGREGWIAASLKIVVSPVRFRPSPFRRSPAYAARSCAAGRCAGSRVSPPRASAWRWHIVTHTRSWTGPRCLRARSRAKLSTAVAMGSMLFCGSAYELATSRPSATDGRAGSRSAARRLVRSLPPRARLDEKVDRRAARGTGADERARRDACTT
jgi:hypothetical protein